MIKIRLFFCNMEIVWVPQGKYKESKSIYLCKRWQPPNPQEHGIEMKSMISSSKFLSDFSKIIAYDPYNAVMYCVNN